MVKPGSVLLSLEIQPTIIGPEAFHCPVRNGKEWYRHRAKPVVSEVHQLNSRDEVFAKRSKRRNAIICIHCASKSIVRFSTASH